MSFLKKTIGVLSVFSLIPAAYAVTARPSVLNGSTSRRMPTMTAYINGAVNTGTTTTTTTSSLLDNTECIDAYTECIKSDDACGSDMSECTTNVLFHGKMPQCLSTLAQCSAAGINSLFGTSVVNALSNVATKNSDGEITRYTYPTDGSVLGQMITAAAIENMYDTSTCVKRYTACLNKDTVCGADFELCTDVREFKKQALFCESTLARCQADGVRELLGTYPWSPSSGTVSGRVMALIEDGAQLAAMNAVSTCYKVIDQCFLGACSSNPLRCLAGSTLKELQAANEVAADGITIKLANENGESTPTDVNRYLRSACLDTIGANKYCHMTFREKSPSKAELGDVDVQEEVFDEAIAQRKKYVETKIQDIMQKFDTNAKNKCVETIRACAMRSCGEGIGSVCYTSVFNGTNESINKPETRADIKTACEAIVNTDANCLYAYASIADQAYSYAYLNNSVFDTMFPEYDSTTKHDPIGVVASLNASLSTSYSAAAIAEMKKQCQTVATSCVKSMCGPDYVNCYRNRTDITSSLTQTNDATFNRSMNKVGGVLDYTIVLGLCMNTVKNAAVCDEHLKIQKARLKLNDTSVGNNWGAGESVRDGWVDAGGAKTVDYQGAIQKTDENGNKICMNSKGDENVCYEMDEDGDIYDDPVMESYDTYLTTQSANTLFRELITDIEHEAQALYNAKITKQQNMCMALNDGGIMGKNDMGSTYMWVKLKSGKVPANYTTNGLSDKQFVASNELYGSFCRVRVNLQSTDETIQEYLSSKPWATTYFAVGDAFTCGSWIPQSDLRAMAQKVADAAYTKDKKTSDTILQTVLPIIGVVGGGFGGAALGAAIQDGSALSGITGKKKKSTKTDQERCEEYVDLAQDALSRSLPNMGTVKMYAEKAIKMIKEEDKSVASLLKWDSDWPAATATAKSNKKTVVSTIYVCGDSNNDVGQNTVCWGNDTLNSHKSQVADFLSSIEDQCSVLDEDDDDKDEKEDTEAKKKRNAAIAGAVVTSVAGGLLTWGVTRSAIDAKRSKEEQAAIDEFMNTLGSKINCVIGADTNATYGEIVVSTME